MATNEYDITVGFIYKEAVGKHKELQVACEQVIDALRPHMKIDITLLRDKCILPLRLAIQTGNGELGAQGIRGMRQLLSDERLSCAFESDSPNDYLHIKLLRAIFDSRSTLLLANSAAQQSNAVQLIQLMQEMCLLCPQLATEYCVVDLLFGFTLSVFKDPRCSAKLRQLLRSSFCQVLAEFAARCTPQPNQESEAETESEVHQVSEVRVDATHEKMLQTLNKAIQFCATELRATIRAHIEALRAFGAYSQHVSSVATRPPLVLALAALRALFENVRAVTNLDRLIVSTRLGATIWREVIPTVSSLFGDPRLIRDETDATRANTSIDPLSSGSPSHDVEELARNACELCVQITLCCADSLELRSALQAALHRTLLFERYRPHALRAVRKLVSSSDCVWSLLVAIDDRQSGSSAGSPLPVATMVGGQSLRVAYASGILQLILDCVAHTLRTNASFISVQQDTMLPFVGGSMLLGGDTPNVDELHSVSSDLVYQMLSSLSLLAKESQTSFSRLTYSTDFDAQIEDKAPVSAPFEDYTVRSAKDKQNDVVTGSDGVSMVAPETIDELENARLFYKELKEEVPRLIGMVNREQIDLALQTFASNFVAKHVVTRISSPRCNLQFLNADSVYVCAYVALIYSIHLSADSSGVEKDVCSQFIADVVAMHTQMYVSESWLTELYRCVIEAPLLTVAQLDSTLVSLLNDVDYTQHASLVTRHARQVNTNVQRAVLRKFLTERFPQLAEIVVAMLTYSQPNRSEQSVPTAASTLNRSFGVASMKPSKSCNELSQTGSATTTDNVLLALETTECLLQLLSDLDMHNLCEKLLNKLLDLVTVELRSMRSTSTAQLLKMRSTSALVCEIVLRRALVLCIPYPPCWIAALRCCTLVSRFDRLASQTELSAAPAPAPTAAPTPALVYNMAHSQANPYESEQVTPKQSTSYGQDVILRSVIQSFQPNKDALSASFILNAIQTRVVLTKLTQMVDQVFVDTLNTLKLKHTVEFIEQYAEYICTLCGDRDEINVSYDPSFSYSLSATLTRFWNILLSLVQTKSRPLVLFEALRILRSLTASTCPLPKLTNQIASCFSSVSANALLKTHLSTLHEFTLSFLTVVEAERHLPHFTVNESLMKLYVDILITSDSYHESMLEAQTQSHALSLSQSHPAILISEELLSSIHELVEVHATKIRSGWRPLFSVIRHVRTSTGSWTKSAKALMQVVDVARAFLALESFPIFAESAFDFAQTLLAYLACECSKHTRDKCAHTAISLLNSNVFSYCEQDDSDSDSDNDAGSANYGRSCSQGSSDIESASGSESDVEVDRIPDPPKRRRQRGKIDLFVKVLEAYTPRIVKDNLTKLSTAPRKTTANFDIDFSAKTENEFSIDLSSLLEEEGHAEFCIRLLELIEQLFDTLLVLAVDQSNEPNTCSTDAETFKYVRKLVALFESVSCIDFALPQDLDLPFKSFCENYDSEEKLAAATKSLKQLEAENGTSSCGVLHLLAFLIDSLCTSLLHCDVSHICNVIDTIFRLLDKAKEKQSAFVYFLFAHSVLPLAQKWLRALIASDLVSLSQLHNTNIPKNIRSRVRYILVCFQHYCIKLTQFFSGAFARPSSNRNGKQPELDLAFVSLLSFLSELSFISGNFILSRCSIICFEIVLSSCVLRHFTESNWRTVLLILERLVVVHLQPAMCVSKYVESESKHSSRQFPLECRPLRRMHRVEWSNRIQIANILFGCRFSEKLGTQTNNMAADDPARFSPAYYDYVVLLKHRDGQEKASEIQLPTLLHRTACCFALVRLVQSVTLRNPTFRLPPRLAEIDSQTRAMFEVGGAANVSGESLVEHLPSVLAYDSLTHEILTKLLNSTLCSIFDNAAQFEQNENTSAYLEVHLLLNKLLSYAGCAGFKSESRPLHSSGFGVSRLLKFAATVHANVLLELCRHASDDKRRERSLNDLREFFRHVASFLARSSSTVEPPTETVSLADCRTLSVKLLDNFRACASPKPKEETPADAEDEQLGMRFLSTVSETLVAILALLEQSSDVDLQRFVPSLFPTLISTIVPFLWSNCAALRGNATQPLGKAIQSLMDAVIRLLERIAQLDVEKDSGVKSNPADDGDTTTKASSNELL